MNTNSFIKMSYSYKKLFMILVAVLVANIIFKNICIHFFNNSLECKIFYKTILILSTVILIKKADLLKKLYPVKNAILFIIISIGLLLVSFRYINIVATKNFINLDINEHLAFILSCFSTGLFEELFFRIFTFYFILKIFKTGKHNLVLAILLSSLIFGFSHLTNIFNPTFHKISILNQVFFAISIGIFLQSLYFRFKSIILIVTLHSLINYLGLYKRNLIKFVNETDTPYDYNDFISTFISILIFTIVIIIPFSYLLIRQNLNKKIVI